MKEIAEGAEAKIFADKGTVIKERIAKEYRIKEIDRALRAFRTKREAKVIEKLQNLIPIPKLISSTDYSIKMQLINGIKLRDALNKKNYKTLCKIVGRQIGLMHKNDIIHGDLTTSNMIVKGKEIYFIDFGLSFFSSKIEDKAVDLHLLRQTLESKHHQIWKECFDAAVAGYKSSNPQSEEILNRFKKVEERGRNKGKA